MRIEGLGFREGEGFVAFWGGWGAWVAEAVLGRNLGQARMWHGGQLKWSQGVRFLGDDNIGSTSKPLKDPEP